MVRIISFSAQKILREMVNVCWSKNEKIFHEILILFQFKKAGQAEMKNDEILFFGNFWKIVKNFWKC